MPGLADLHCNSLALAVHAFPDLATQPSGQFCRSGVPVSAWPRVFQRTWAIREGPLTLINRFDMPCEGLARNIACNSLPTLVTLNAPGFAPARKTPFKVSLPRWNVAQATASPTRQKGSAHHERVRYWRIRGSQPHGLDRGVIQCGRHSAFSSVA